MRTPPRLRPATLLDAARREPRSRRTAWVALAAFMALGPLIVTLARAPAFTAGIDLLPQPVGPFGAVHHPDYYRAFLADPKLRQEIDEALGARIDGAVYDRVTIRTISRESLRVSAELDTPAEAREFVRALAPQLGGASARDLARRAGKIANRSRAALRHARTPSERRRLRRDVRRYGTLARSFSPRVLFGREPGTPRLRRWADRLVDRLPGGFPGRPSPVWAALAGLVNVAILWAIALVLLPPGGRSPRSPEDG